MVLGGVHGCAPAANTAAGKLAPAAERIESPATLEQNSTADPNARVPVEATLPETSDPETVEDEAPQDGEFETPPESDTAPVRAHPLDGWTSEQIANVVRTDISRLGSLSLGAPSAGALLNGVRAEACPLFEPVHAEGAWATEETLQYLSAAIRKVHEQFPDTPPLSLGHISDRDGGPLSPHLSHQSGRDVDLSFYYSNGASWYARATRANLDLPRTWALVRALITETDVEMILADHSVQALLRKYALEHGENPEWVQGLFAGTAGGLRPIIRHAPGHATHLHIRFYNPIAQESARRCQRILQEEGKTRAMASFVRHRARRGETLGKLAKRYRVTVEAIKAANGLRSSLIREKREYRIPVRAAPPPPRAEPLRFPARRLPPEPVRLTGRDLDGAQSSR